MFLKTTYTVKKATNKFYDYLFKVSAPPLFFDIFLIFAWFNFMTFIVGEMYPFLLSMGVFLSLCIIELKVKF